MNELDVQRDVLTSRGNVFWLERFGGDHLFEVLAKAVAHGIAEQFHEWFDGAVIDGLVARRNRWPEIATGGLETRKGLALTCAM